MQNSPLDCALPQASCSTSLAGASPGPSALSRLWVVAGWIGLAAVVFSLSFFPLRTSTDEWWHLKTGKWIVENGYRLPQKDVFTYTAADYDWDNHEWLSQVGMYLLWRWGEARTVGGWRAVILAKAFLLVAAYLLLARLLALVAGGSTRGAAIGIFLALVAAAAGRRMFWPRPPVVSSLLMVVFLYVMWLHRAGRLRTGWLLALAALMPLWANLHGGFLLGGLVVAAYCAGAGLEWAWGCFVPRHKAGEALKSRKRFGAYLVLGLLCGVGSLCNPFGYKLYLLPGRVMRSTHLLEVLGEMLPPDFRYTWAYAFLLALLGAGFCVLGFRALRRRPLAWPPAADVLLAVFFFWQSIHHMRHLGAFALAATPLAAWFLSRAAQGGRLAPARLLNPALAGASLVVGLWLVFFPGEAIHTLPAAWSLASGRIEASRVEFAPSQFQRNLDLLEREFDPRAYPIQAVDFILRAQLPPHMFNRNNCAGYLIWALSPERYRVFTDSRFDIFGEDFLVDEESVSAGLSAQEVRRYYANAPNPRPGLRPWLEVVKQYGINWLFLARSEFINTQLAQEGSGWALVYLDLDWRIWLRKAPENKPWLDKYADPRLLESLRKTIPPKAVGEAR